MKKLLCLLFGHKPIVGLFEDKDVITNKGCKRCGAALMTSRCLWKGIRFCTPPWSNTEQWNRFMDEEEAEYRLKFGNHP